MELSISQITRNTIPNTISARRFRDDYAVSFAATEDGSNITLQVKVYFYLLDEKSGDTLFSFEVTSTSKPFPKPHLKVLVPAFIEFMNTAVDEFNRYIKANKSPLTLNKFKPYPQASNELIHAIRAALISNNRFSPPTSLN